MSKTTNHFSGTARAALLASMVEGLYPNQDPAQCPRSMPFSGKSTIEQADFPAALTSDRLIMG